MTHSAATRAIGAGTHRLASLLVLICAVGMAAAGSAWAQARPGHNRQTQSAERSLGLALVQQQPEARERHFRAALESAMEAVANDPANPTAWFFAGQAYVGLGDLAGADSALTRAVELHPDFEDEIAVEREQAWAQAYDRGAEAYQADRIEESISHFELADRLSRKWPYALVTLAWLYSATGDDQRSTQAYDAALEIFRRGPIGELTPEQQAEWDSQYETTTMQVGDVLVASGRRPEAAALYREFLAANPGHLRATVGLAGALDAAGPGSEADSLLSSLLERDDLDEENLFRIGAAMFEADRFERSATAFRRAAEQNPHSRDAVYNLAQALFMLGRELQDEAADDADARTRLVAVYEELGATAERLRAMDANNRDVYRLLAQAYQGLTGLATEQDELARWNERLTGIVQAHDALQFEVLDIRIGLEGDRIRVTGTVENIKAEPGTEIRVRMTILGEDGGELASDDAAVAAPAVGEAAAFELLLGPVAGMITGWKYTATP